MSASGRESVTGSNDILSVLRGLACNLTIQDRPLRGSVFCIKQTINMANKGQIGVTTENIFPVIKQFLYSDHEIFLRELVANAVDATQKLKALAASGDC